MLRIRCLVKNLNIEHLGRASRRSCFSTNRTPLSISDEVVDAIKNRKPVVALETTIYTHGFPHPENIALSSSLESLVRKHGGIPATIGIINGTAKVGMTITEISELLEKAGDPRMVKVSRRDLGFVCGRNNYYGGTTIAGTVVLAHRAGIKVFATGGLGGVHRDRPGETSMDVSADLTELGRTPIALVSSGCKSFLDIPRTLEFLETQGVGVGTFADGREGEVKFPAFWTRESDCISPNVIEDEKEAAAILYAQLRLQLQSGLVFANPIPSKDSLSNDTMNLIMGQANREASEKNITGGAVTPYVLTRIKELTNGGTVEANRSLVESNIIRGTKVAVELARLEADQSVFNGVFSLPNVQLHQGRPSPHVDVIVAGSIALDLSCDYTPSQSHAERTEPMQHTSNPARITQTLGGVGRNLATACHYMGASTVLCSIVGNDAAGVTAVDMLKETGLEADGIIKAHNDQRTAQYIAMNNTKGDLVMAMADMNILEAELEDFSQTWSLKLRRHHPRWLIVDANWSSEALYSWIKEGKEIGARIAYEPVSVEKSSRLWTCITKASALKISENLIEESIVDVAAPNQLELAAMANALASIESHNWFDSVLASLVEDFTRFRFDNIPKSVFFDAIRLLRHIPCILVKLGATGVLQVQIIGPDEVGHQDNGAHVCVIPIPRSCLKAAEKTISLPISAIYIRHHPVEPIETRHGVLSVNGAGDTFLGVLVARLSRTGSFNLKDAIELAQTASRMTLQSSESVSPDIRRLAS